MALLRRQSPTYASLDDQGPEMWGSFVGNWTHNTTPSQGFYNYTFTATQTPGASLSFRFSGSQAWIYGSRTANGTNGVTIYYPTADYTVDGASAGSQQPSIESDTGRIIYFQTPLMADGPHEIDFTVTSADELNQFVLDYITIIPSSGTETSQSGSSSTTTSSSSSSSSLPTTMPPSPIITATHSTPVGAIAGGVVGGVIVIGIAIFALGLCMGWWSCPCIRSGSIDEDPVKQSPTTTTTSAPSIPTTTRPDTRPAYSDRQTVVGSDLSQLRSGGAGTIIQNPQSMHQPIPEEDAGAELNGGGGRGTGTSQMQTSRPPPYVPR